MTMSPDDGTIDRTIDAMLGVGKVQRYANPKIQLAYWKAKLDTEKDEWRRNLARLAVDMYQRLVDGH